MPCYSVRRRCSRVQSLTATETVMKNKAEAPPRSLLRRLFGRASSQAHHKKSQRTIESTVSHHAHGNRCRHDHADHDDDDDEPITIHRGRVLHDDVAFYPYQNSQRVLSLSAAPPQQPVPSEISIPISEQHNDDNDNKDDDSAYWETLDAACDSSSNDGESESPAHACYSQALDCLDDDSDLEPCVAHAQRGLQLLVLDHDDDLRGKLLHVLAEAFVKLEQYSQALETYQQLLTMQQQRSDQEYTPFDAANLLYACGRIAARTKDHEAAMDYLQQALKLLTSNDASLAACIYRELAHECSDALGNPAKAVYWLERALAAESALYQQVLKESRQCCHSNGGGGTTARCHLHATQLQTVKEQVQRTKKSIGRIHYEQGDLDKAIRFTMMRSTLV